MKPLDTKVNSVQPLKKIKPINTQRAQAKSVLLKSKNKVVKNVDNTSFVNYDQNTKIVKYDKKAKIIKINKSTKIDYKPHNYI